MFVDQTVGGVLAKRLQMAEDRLAGITGYRVRITETSGSQLRRILPNTNPWQGMDCMRPSCYTCSRVGIDWKTASRETSCMKVVVHCATLRRAQDQGRGRN